MKRTILVILLALAVTYQAEAVKVFKWVDSSGQIHYGDKVPGSKESSNVESQNVDANANVIQSNTQPSTTNQASASKSGDNSASGAPVAATGGDSGSAAGSSTSTTGDSGSAAGSSTSAAGSSTSTTGGSGSAASSGSAAAGNTPSTAAATTQGTSASPTAAAATPAATSSTGSSGQKSGASSLSSSTSTVGTGRGTGNSTSSAGGTGFGPSSNKLSNNSTTKPKVQVLNISSTGSGKVTTSSGSGSIGSGGPLDCADHPEAMVCVKFRDQTSVTESWTNASGKPCVPDALYDENEKAARLRIGTKCPADSAGDFRYAFPKQTGQLWLQFRYKVEQGYITAPHDYKGGLGSAKVFVLWSGKNSCTTHEFTQEDAYARGLPQWYETCGSRNLQVEQPNHDWDYQPGGSTGCFRYYTNENPPFENPSVGPCAYLKEKWATYTYHLDFDGSQHSGTPWVDGWIQYDGESRVHMLSLFLKNTREADHVMFTPYSYRKDPKVDHPVWSVWYQDLLVTTKPLIN